MTILSAAKKNINIFLSLCISLCVMVFSLALFAGCSAPLERFEDTRDKMGTYVSIVIYSADEDARKILDSGFDRIDEQSKIASNYDPESSVSKLNADGFINDAPPELLEMVELSIEYNQKTRGAFEITVDPVLKLWSEGLWQESEEVQQQKISEALELVGSKMIIVDGRNIKFEREGMSVTLGGIAKGYIVDKVIETLKEAGIKNALVNAGGDIATLGSKPGGEKWTVSLENPDNTAEKIATFAVAGEAIATSGNYYRYFDPDKEVHHIIDPRTGYSANECISVTIIAENATTADILSTSVFVLGPGAGLQLVEELSGVEALIIDSERNITKSSGIEKYLIE